MPYIMIFGFICFSLSFRAPLFGESGTTYSEPGLKINSSTSDYEFDRMMGDDVDYMVMHEPETMDQVSYAIDVFYDDQDSGVPEQKAQVTDITFQVRGQTLSYPPSGQRGSLGFSHVVQAER